MNWEKIVVLYYGTFGTHLENCWSMSNLRCLLVLMIHGNTTCWRGACRTKLMMSLFNYSLCNLWPLTLSQLLHLLPMVSVSLFLSYLSLILNTLELSIKMKYNNWLFCIMIYVFHNTLTLKQSNLFSYFNQRYCRVLSSQKFCKTFFACFSNLTCPCLPFIFKLGMGGQYSLHFSVCTISEKQYGIFILIVIICWSEFMKNSCNEMNYLHSNSNGGDWPMAGQYTIIFMHINCMYFFLTIIWTSCIASEYFSSITKPLDRWYITKFLNHVKMTVEVSSCT